MARKRLRKKPPVASTEVTGFYVKIPVPQEVLEMGTRVNTIINEASDLAEGISSFLKKFKS